MVSFFGGISRGFGLVGFIVVDVGCWSIVRFCEWIRMCFVGLVVVEFEIFLV